MLTDSHETMRDRAFVTRLLGELEAGRRFALATILATHGSMPRGASARMALIEDGSWLGTVGGGQIELMAQERCRRVLAGEEPDSLEWMTHAKTDMACGGDALVGISCWDAGREGLLRRLADVLGSEGTAWLLERWPVGDVTSGPVVGTPEVMLAGDSCPADGAADDFGSLLGEDVAWDEAGHRFAEPVGADPVCYVFGGGHVGRALTPVLASVGFRVVILDDRAGVAVPKDFPHAEKVIHADLRRIADYVDIHTRDYAVVTTHGHAWDIDVLEQLAPIRPAYVGCIGSRRKAGLARKTLAERGVSKEWLDSVHLPIGDDILAVTPPEIAISIAAEMIRARAELRPVRPHQASHTAC
ncbi:MULTISPECIES: XdhC family protein [Atopobiaceae]|uniref:Xanthine dehydrogenase accessory factor n=1 Tax=Parafannyhessea umbonata TaxID=604330 RepID=A0A1H6IAU3_9ACTN|nr:MULTISPECIES: XdhC/CoxI family protein [Atopobiaceae]SEH44195.1 xanthine dehydrogenase accessory factor [Parafannyhessea umbonata]SJZ59520.1 xanthine dehydrogenase accessory factor [Olsenella sp. KH1P3]